MSRRVRRPSSDGAFMVDWQGSVLLRLDHNLEAMELFLSITINGASMDPNMV